MNTRNQTSIKGANPSRRALQTIQQVDEEYTEMIFSKEDDEDDDNIINSDNFEPEACLSENSGSADNREIKRQIDEIDQ